MPSLDRILGAFVASTFIVVTFAGVAGGQDGDPISAVVPDELLTPSEPDDPPPSEDQPAEQPSETEPTEDQGDPAAEPSEAPDENATTTPDEEPTSEPQPTRAAPVQQPRPQTAAGAPEPLRPPSTDRVDPETGLTFEQQNTREAVDIDNSLWQLLALPPALLLLSVGAYFVARAHE